MSSRIEELNLTIPDSIDVQEQQRVLIENFSLIRDLLVSPGYMHAHRHKDTTESLSTTYLVISGYDHQSLSKHINLTLASGLFTLDIDGVYRFDIFLHVEGSGSDVYTIGLLENSTTELASYDFDAHDPGGHVYQFISFDQEFSPTWIEESHNLALAIKLQSGSGNKTVAFVHVSIIRIDNYNIP